MNAFILLFSFFGLPKFALSAELMVVGNNFSVPATQQISFVPLKKSVLPSFIKVHNPKVLDLRDIQSSVKSQGQRGACTYFTISSLVESIIKKSLNKEIDISEEYIAWVGKAKKGMRSNEEDSSVAVNAVALQEFGFMLESDLPYQQSWFDKGAACEGQRDATNIDPICYSHSGPDQEKLKRIISGKNFVFESVNSSSLDVIKALSARGIPVTVSILAHPKTWSNSVKSGEIAMTNEMKEECLKKVVRCSGHAALIVGYNLLDKKFLIKNSWGESWGDKGYGSISFDYLDQMSSRLFLTGYLANKLELPEH